MPSQSLFLQGLLKMFHFFLDLSLMNFADRFVPQDELDRMFSVWPCLFCRSKKCWSYASVWMFIPAFRRSRSFSSIDTSTCCSLSCYWKLFLTAFRRGKGWRRSFSAWAETKKMDISLKNFVLRVCLQTFRTFVNVLSHHTSIHQNFTLWEISLRTSVNEPYLFMKYGPPTS